MPTIGLPPLAAAFPWMNLVWVIVGITVFLFAVAGVGRWLAATHPDAPAKPAAPAATPAAAGVASAQADAIAAAIAAAVHVTLGASAKVTSVTPVPPAVSVENLMLTWSLEGRRQIYTSHKVR
jgi:hypothetical protein